MSLELEYGPIDIFYYQNEKTQVPLLQKNCLRWTALCLKSPFWMETRYGEELSTIPEETQALLIDSGEGHFKAYIINALFPGRPFLRGTIEGQLKLSFRRRSEIPFQSHKPLLISVASNQPGVALSTAFDELCRMELTSSNKTEKKKASILGKLGWCTWDAFYRTVTDEKMKKAFDLFKSSCIPIRFCILDDGWQKTLNGAGQLFDWQTSFEASKSFPEGFRKLTKFAAERAVDEIYIWQSWSLYWAGITSSIDPSLTYADFETSLPGSIDEHVEGLSIWKHKLHLPDTIEDMEKLILRQFDYFRKEGIKGVKVDVQGLMGVLRDKVGKPYPVRAYHEKLSCGVRKNFSNNIIHCMGCNLENLMSISPGSIVRTSDDFFPDKPASHGRHIRDNAMVAALIHKRLTSDWDMFMSGHYTSKFHGLARIISGGPVYISDKPENADEMVLRRIADSNGRIRSFSKAPEIATDCFFSDPCLRNQKPLLLRNGEKGIMLIAGFNCSGSEVDITWTLKDFSNPKFNNLSWLFWNRNGDGKVKIIDMKYQFQDRIRPLDTVLHVLFSPLIPGGYILGRRDSFHPWLGLDIRIINDKEISFACSDTQDIHFFVKKGYSIKCYEIFGEKRIHISSGSHGMYKVKGFSGKNYLSKISLVSSM